MKTSLLAVQNVLCYIVLICNFHFNHEWTAYHGLVCKYDLGRFLRINRVDPNHFDKPVILTK